LYEYNLDKPFFLSGGIGPGDAQSLRELRHEQLAGSDRNRGFEITPGIKDYDLVSAFITEVKKQRK
jgi:phosphoribosylanthranilate isomerase